MTDTTLARPTARTPRSASARLASLCKAEFVLLRRSKLVLFNAFVMPILPFLALIPIRMNSKLNTELTSLFIGFSMTLILIFVVFYNLLPTYVSRREELVLKRLRTGECSDVEILTGIALPAFSISSVLLLVMSVGAVVGLGQSMPVNALLLLIALLGGCLVFAGLSLVTTVFTKNSEAAQITSLPVVLICVFGAGFSPLDFMPEWVTTLLQYTPLAPSFELTQLGWGGLTKDGATVDFTGSFANAWQPTLTLLAWILIGGWVARTYFRWEPRT